MTICTIEITQLETLSNENDRARSSKAAASTCVGVAVTIFMNWLFMNEEWKDIAPTIKVLTVAGIPVALVLARHFWRDCKRSLTAVKNIRDRMESGSLNAALDINALGHKLSVPKAVSGE